MVDAQSIWAHAGLPEGSSSSAPLDPVGIPTVPTRQLHLGAPILYLCHQKVATAAVDSARFTPAAASPTPGSVPPGRVRPPSCMVPVTCDCTPRRAVCAAAAPCPPPFPHSSCLSLPPPSRQTFWQRSTPARGHRCTAASRPPWGSSRCLSPLPASRGALPARRGAPPAVATKKARTNTL